MQYDSDLLDHVDHAREQVWEAFRRGDLDDDEATARLLQIDFHVRHPDDQPPHDQESDQPWPSK